MPHDKDRILIRAKDIGLIIGIVTLATMAFSFYKKLYAWDNSAARVEKIAEIVAVHETKIAINDERWREINDDLKFIKRNMSRNGK